MATPAKLRDGSWGVRVEGSAKTGDQVTVRTKGGKTWSARISQVVWTDGKVALCATESDRPAPRRSSGGGCHTDGNCSSMCNPSTCPCGDGGWFSCC